MNFKNLWVLGFRMKVALALKGLTPSGLIACGIEAMATDQNETSVLHEAISELIVMWLCYGVVG